MAAEKDLYQAHLDIFLDPNDPAVIEATLDEDAAPLYPRLRARALLPSGALGERQFALLQAQTKPYAQALALPRRLRRHRHPRPRARSRGRRSRRAARDNLRMTRLEPGDLAPAFTLLDSIC